MGDAGDNPFLHHLHNTPSRDASRRLFFSAEPAENSTRHAGVPSPANSGRRPSPSHRTPSSRRPLEVLLGQVKSAGESIQMSRPTRPAPSPPQSGRANSLKKLFSPFCLQQERWDMPILSHAQQRREGDGGAVSSDNSFSSRPAASWRATRIQDAREKRRTDGSADHEQRGASSSVPSYVPLAYRYVDTSTAAVPLTAPHLDPSTSSNLRPPRPSPSTSYERKSVPERRQWHSSLLPWRSSATTPTQRRPSLRREWRSGERESRFEKRHSRHSYDSPKQLISQQTPSSPSSTASVAKAPSCSSASEISQTHVPGEPVRGPPGRMGSCGSLDSLGGEVDDGPTSAAPEKARWKEGEAWAPYLPHSLGTSNALNALEKSTRFLSTQVGSLSCGGGSGEGTQWNQPRRSSAAPIRPFGKESLREVSPSPANPGVRQEARQRGASLTSIAIRDGQLWISSPSCSGRYQHTSLPSPPPPPSAPQRIIRKVISPPPRAAAISHSRSLPAPSFEEAIQVLKARYALLPHEEEKPIESLQPEDIDELVRCLSVDLHRTVEAKRGKSSAGTTSVKSASRAPPERSSDVGVRTVNEPAAAASFRSPLPFRKSSPTLPPATAATSSPVPRVPSSAGGAVPEAFRPASSRSASTHLSGIPNPLRASSQMSGCTSVSLSVGGQRKRLQTSNIVKVPLPRLLPRLKERSTLVGWYLPPSMKAPVEPGSGSGASSGWRRPVMARLWVKEMTVLYHGVRALMPHLLWKSVQPVAGEPGGWRCCNLTDICAVEVGTAAPYFMYNASPGLAEGAGGDPDLAALSMPPHCAATTTAAGSGALTLSPAFQPYADFFFAPSASTPAILNPQGEPISEYWLAAITFYESQMMRGGDQPVRRPPLLLSFFTEQDRQLWVGALMGVVERNQTLHVVPQEKGKHLRES